MSEHDWSAQSRPTVAPQQLGSRNADPPPPPQLPQLPRRSVLVAVHSSQRVLDLVQLALDDLVHVLPASSVASARRLIDRNAWSGLLVGQGFADGTSHDIVRAARWSRARGPIMFLPDIATLGVTRDSGPGLDVWQRAGLRDFAASVIATHLERAGLTRWVVQETFGELEVPHRRLLEHLALGGSLESYVAASQVDADTVVELSHEVLERTGHGKLEGLLDTIALGLVAAGEAPPGSI